MIYEDTQSRQKEADNNKIYHDMEIKCSFQVENTCC